MTLSTDSSPVMLCSGSGISLNGGCLSYSCGAEGDTLLIFNKISKMLWILDVKARDLASVVNNGSNDDLSFVR